MGPNESATQSATGIDVPVKLTRENAFDINISIMVCCFLIDKSHTHRKDYTVILCDLFVVI